ncbi:MAG TPA: preprotein translocase subunit SecG [Nitrospirota bacterium]
MTVLLTVLHIIVSIALIIAVLLQKGKGAEIGASFGGGSSQTLFGSRGSGNFMTKATAVIGTIFMLTSLSLAVMSTNVVGGSVVEELPEQAAPAAATENMPAGPPAAAGQDFGAQQTPAGNSAAPAPEGAR